MDLVYVIELKYQNYPNEPFNKITIGPIFSNKESAEAYCEAEFGWNRFKVVEREVVN